VREARPESRGNAFRPCWRAGVLAATLIAMGRQGGDSVQSDDALSRLRSELKGLRRDRGEPSGRAIARNVRGEISHNTVLKWLECERLPPWGILEPLVRGLGGDEAKFRRLWRAVRDQQEPLSSAPEDSGERDADEPGIPQLRTLEDADHAQAELDERAQQQRQEQESLREQLVSARDQLADLNDQLAGLRGQLSQMQQQASADASLRGRLEAEIASLEQERDQLYEEIEKLRDKLRQSREEMIELLEQSIQIAARRSELNREWARSEEALRRRHEADLAREREQVRTLQEELARLNAALADLGTSSSSPQDEARLLLADSEHLARTIADPGMRAEALLDTAKVLATIDPPAAERLARTVTAPHLEYQALILADTARALVRQNPSEARRLLDDAEHVATTLPDGGSHSPRNFALRGIAQVLAELDLVAAERLFTAARVYDPSAAAALARIARAAAEGDPAQARGLLADAEQHGKNLFNNEIVKVMARLDPREAERLACTISAPASRALALARIARVMVERDQADGRRLLTEAERLVSRPVIGLPPVERARAITGVARIVAEWDPAEAGRLLAEVEDMFRQVYSSSDIDALLDSAVALAKVDLGKAERLVRDIDPGRPRALTQIAFELAETDPAEAERIALTITHPDHQSKALAHIAATRAERMSREAR
jgi:uncharacterized coiled-coil DUF342 family protein